MFFKVVFVLFAVQQASAVIYRLNETEYDRLPPLFQLEPYFPCLRARGDLYCYVDARLVSDVDSELLTLIQEYSAYTTTHYNHTVVHRGVCVTQSCRGRVGNGTDLADTLEGCLNNTLYATHQLKAKLIRDKVYCTDFDEKVPIDWGDCAVATVVIALLALSLLGSCYDFCCPVGNNIGSRLLLCFSARRNWQRLVLPSGEGPEPRLKRLKSFNGLKAITAMLVILGHSPLGEILNTNNPDYIETTYHNPLYSIFYSGTVIVQIFFLMSGFLLAYNILILGEKREVNWEMLLKGVLLRWLRQDSLNWKLLISLAFCSSSLFILILTPVYAVILAVVSTWLRHFGSGPLWKPTVGVEVVDCRRDWFYNLLYLNNYIDNSQCMAHTWYLAADMQLSVLGLVIFCVLSGQGRKMAVMAVFVVGLVTPAIHTYLGDLHPILIVSPEVARQYFVTDPTFNSLYKRGHTNAVCYALGMALGMLTHHLQNADFDVQKYKKYRSLYWALVPLTVCLEMTGGVLYIDGIEVPLAVRMLYSSAVKLTFGVIAFTFIGGLIFKFENVYRGILEWRGWAAVGRVSYCAYLLHISVIRLCVADHTSTVHSSFYHILLNYLGAVTISFVIAVPCWVLVEAPCGQLVRVLSNPGQREVYKSVTMAREVVVMGSKETIDIKL